MPEESVKKNDIKSNSWADIFYMLTGAVLYIIIFFSPGYAFVLHLFYLFLSYFLIVRRRELYPVLVLIVYARSFVGFSASSGVVPYTVLNVLTNYMPAVLYFMFSYAKPAVYKSIKIYPATYLYGLVLFIYSIIGGSASLAVLGDRLIPFYIFIILLTKGFESERVVGDFRLLMRPLIVSSIIVILIPGYSEKTISYLAEGIVFGEEANTSVLLGDLLRGLGPFWDPRVLGVMSALYLVSTLSTERRRGVGIDVALALTGVAMSLSRGSFVFTAIVFLFFIFRSLSFANVLFLMGAASILFYGVFEVVQDSFLSVFFVNEVDPLSQRSEFLNFAISQFLNNPFGAGVGKMRSLDSGVSVSGFVYDAITDAYIGILLAEIGIIGFIVFVLSFREIFWNKNKLAPAVFIGFFVQMIGTDIPDFGPFYLVILIVGLSVSRINSPVRGVGR